MRLKPVPPEVANEMVKKGALLIDVRASDEYCREHIGVARNIPMERPGALTPLKLEQEIIFHCKSGNRTNVDSVALNRFAGGAGYVLEGGLEAWRKSGLRSIRDVSQPIEMQRQVQIAAGSLTLFGRS